ncbi:aminotransferase class V-fold PLP-dependent enzyme [Pullulanibacillus sp. KACC 23026]|uniref:aminotransferase class V-fold PLP-dependent enzyme n=1 Tax=Pullulanibacillus sp. KACC 23026 TaxID=3028315 RepID=UPI0023AF3932|nr:aminotransferase class V-fold PLP-dependent enzyme [Pullulanibacillus sp. KACC 23026]WEG15046.1 aminotransferase class V-fold PLP-dependent enzyme [Pullulanibacillus sp. KACC 23026]
MITARIGSKTYQYNSELEAYFSQFRKHIIGVEQTFQSPFGEKKIIYADWIASGRLYGPIEDKVRNVFGPYMANTHTESNLTGGTMTLAYEEAKRIIKRHVHANNEDVVLLEGSGMTSVMAKFQRILGLKGPEKWKRYMSLSEEERPIVFISHMEHHSNQTSWIETIADVKIVPRSKDGHLDIEALKELLHTYRNRPLKIGAFTACSNVTGICLPYHQLARVMHEHGGICLVDFAASAPYIEIDMHPEDPLESLDGIFFSAHKFLGGPGASGVTVFNKRLYQNKIPDEPGGGTVTWTNPWGEHHYISDIEKREDGGTPGILQGIRAALAIRLKEKMGIHEIQAREKELLEIVLPGLESIPEVQVLEGDVTNRLGVVSFVVEGLHYNLIVKLLNDRFGYQVRGGCSCAGTYGHYLLQIDQESSKSIAKKIDQGDFSLKPGWVRFSAHPTMTNEEAYGFVDAIKQILAHKEEWSQDYLYDSSTNDFFYIRDTRRDYNELFTL